MGQTSEWLENVLQAYQELGVKVAHRKDISLKVKEIRERKGLHLGKYEQWVQYVLQHFSRGKAKRDYFRPIKLGSGYWEIVIAQE